VSYVGDALKDYLSLASTAAPVKSSAARESLAAAQRKYMCANPTPLPNFGVAVTECEPLVALLSLVSYPAYYPLLSLPC
jgi:hypothetical protein